jgi:hypothetical protein
MVILEHFAANTEERELAAYGNGMLIWGNSNYNFSEAAMGYHDGGKSDFSWASYQQRGFSKPGLVAYMESHDEERQLFKTLSFGSSSGAYNTKDLATALERSQLATAFFLALPGPKMIWQFGELGYDVSIDQNGRVGEKPVRWEYLNDPKRLKLFDVYSAMLRLRTQFDVFTSGTETRALSGITKKLQLTLGDHHITLIGNFGTSDQSIVPEFQNSGTWYEFFTGNELQVSDVNNPILLKPGEYRLYSNKKLPAFKELATASVEKPASSKFRVFPNPASNFFRIEAKDVISAASLFSADGKLIRKEEQYSNTINFAIQVKTSGQVFTEKVVVQ